MNNTVFTGVATAIVTPLTQDGIDFEAFGRLIDWQIAQGVNAIVAAGTTGEGSTLTDEEHRAVIKFTVDRVAGRVPVIAGTGSNDTAYAIELTKYACEVGADAMLVVSPYYNKATQKGLVASFTAIADASTKPVILYNVPGRTGVNIPLSVYRELAKHERIVATKEASGNLSAIAELMAECGKGVISVWSDVMPREAAELCAAWRAGDTARAAALQLGYLDLMNTLFCEVNPIPVKTAMSLMGYGTEEFRLPLCEMQPANKEKLIAVLRKHGLLA